VFFFALHETNSILAPENRVGPKRKVVFQITTFQWLCWFQGGYMCLVGPERTWKGEVSKTHTPVVVQVILAEIPEAVFFVVSWLLEFQTQMLHVTGIFTYYEFTIKQSTIHV